MKHQKPVVGKGPDRSVVLVLGMHRSGTSALTRVLNLLGVPLGDELLQPQDDNSKGFWEHAAAVEIHEKLLAALGRNWHDVREMPEGWLEHPATEVAISEIAALVSREMRGQALWAVKDPRMCRLLPLWVAALERLKIGARAVLAVRDPREVALSLHKRDGWTLGHAYLMWIQHLMEALTASSSIPRAIVGYTQLLEDWRPAMDRVATSLGLEWPSAYAAVGQEIDGFLNPQDQHQRAGDPAVSALLDSAPLPALLEHAYRSALDVALGKSDWRALEACAEAYGTAVSVFSLPVRDLVAERNELERVALERMHNIDGLLTAKELVEQRERELRATLEASTAANIELERVALERLNNIEGLVVAKDLIEQRVRELSESLGAHVAQLEWMRAEAQVHVEARKQAQARLDEQAHELDRLSLDRRELDTLRDALERERLFVERAFEVSDKLEKELREKIAERDAEITRLLDEQVKASEERASVIGASAVVERARQEAEDARTVADSRVAELEIHLQAKNSDLAQALAASEGMRQEKNQLEHEYGAKLNDHQREVANLAQRIATLEVEAESLKGDLSETRSAYAKLVEARDGMEDMLRGAAADLTELSLARDAAQAEAAQLSAELDDARALMSDKAWLFKRAIGIPAGRQRGD
ncbi:sulfotransferase [Pseudoxanthomonas japonensis]|uniref:sulfotransferase n=1 Tax=Pseudoxanthomonas japonensis TaxID=69284 RepID=UPI003749C34B